MKKFPVTIPIMIIVVVIALWMLGKDYSEINIMTRIFIAVGAGIFSGIISFFLFRFDKDHTK
ncbi:histidine kinase [Neobacillus niacini]|uniref:histidine kinase n=1 Tax=Neobacillus niacini TaxID=86668 RepID=UPI003B02147F